MKMLHSQGQCGAEETFYIAFWLLPKFLDPLVVGQMLCLGAKIWFQLSHPWIGKLQLKGVLVHWPVVIIFYIQLYSVHPFFYMWNEFIVKLRFKKV